MVNKGKCAVEGCESNEIEIHHIRQLHVRPSEEGEGLTVIAAGKAKRLKGMAAIESALRRKQIPLCKEHHRA